MSLVKTQTARVTPASHCASAGGLAHYSLPPSEGFLNDTSMRTPRAVSRLWTQDQCTYWFTLHPRGCCLPARPVAPGQHPRWLPPITSLTISHRRQSRLSPPSCWTRREWKLIPGEAKDLWTSKALQARCHLHSCNPLAPGASPHFAPLGFQDKAGLDSAALHCTLRGERKRGMRDTHHIYVCDLGQEVREPVPVIELKATDGCSHTSSCYHWRRVQGKVKICKNRSRN